MCWSSDEGSALTNRVAGLATVLRHAWGQRRALYAREDALARRRDDRVRAIVQYAATTVPFYRDVFQKRGSAASDTRSAVDLGRLPLIDKALVQAEPDRFRALTLAGRDAVPIPTAGSTGTPLTVYHDREALLANIAHGERERAVETTILGRGFRRRILTISMPSSTGAVVRRFTRANAALPFQPERRQVSIAAALEHVVDEMHAFRPDIVTSYGSYLETLFRFIDDGGRQPALPRLVAYVGDAMSGEGRRLIEERFGIPVISRYNAVESFKIGFTCEQRSGFHLHPDLCAVRLVDERGDDVAAGAPGEVVISNLVNRGTVLLNYRLGDLARFELEPCACGRTSPRLATVDGRVNEIIHLASGGIVHPFAVLNVLKGRAHVRRHQLVQLERSIFELRLLTDGRETWTTLAGDLETALARVLGGATVIVVRAGDAAWHPRGKFRPVIALPTSEAR